MRTMKVCHFGGTYIKIGTIQRRLAWPLRKHYKLCNVKLGYLEYLKMYCEVIFYASTSHVFECSNNVLSYI